MDAQAGLTLTEIASSEFRIHVICNSRNLQLRDIMPYRGICAFALGS